ncbi:hypothetical protein EDB89DRAFT_1881619 [Lactarius sanguifluus]|nr:hypothetical protein EDB89DRAFT_1881619 [Lactarius sanguifluus]
MELILEHKRSLENSIVDLSRMGMVLNHLDALKDELYGIEETEEEMLTISEHVLQLENILQGAKKPYEPGSRMILDALLLTLRKITSTQEFDIAILPEMRITHGDGVQLSHPTSGYELWLSGNVNYAVIGYEKDKNMDNYNRLLVPGGSRWHTFEIASSCLFLVEANWQCQSEEGLSTHFPEAISQAIALLKIANLPEVRFCLSDGQAWIFFILKSENNTLTFYESTTHCLSRDNVENSDLPLRKIMQLLREWASFSMGSLIYLLRTISLAEPHCDWFV